RLEIFELEADAARILRGHELVVGKGQPERRRLGLRRLRCAFGGGDILDRGTQGGGTASGHVLASPVLGSDAAGRDNSEISTGHTHTGPVEQGQGRRTGSRVRKRGSM